MVEIKVYPVSPEFELSAMTYQNIWSVEGKVIESALMAFSSLPFRVNYLHVQVHGGPTTLGDNGQPIKLHASYLLKETMKANLIRALAIHLILSHQITSKKYTKDQMVKLFLYDLWYQVYGKQFAREQVRLSLYPDPKYRRNWKWALEMSADDRQNLWHTILHDKYRASKG